LDFSGLVLSSNAIERVTNIPEIVIIAYTTEYIVANESII
jgi:hypothetical protein